MSVLRLSIAACLLSCGLFVTPTSAAAAPAAPSPKNEKSGTGLPTIEMFATLPYIEQPILSPDGRRFAAQLAIQGQQVLAIQTGTSHPVLIAVGDSDVLRLRWVNDDWLLVTIGQTLPLSSGRSTYVTRVIAVSAKNLKMNRVPRKDTNGQTANDILWVANDGSPRIILAHQASFYGRDFWPSVSEINVDTGATKLLVHPRAQTMGYFADAHGVVRLALSYDDERRTARLLSRSDNHSAFREIGRADYKRDEELIIPEIFTADPSKAIVTDRSDGFSAVYEYDLTKMELGKQIFSVPGYDVDKIITDAAGTSLAGVSYTDTRSRMHWFDARLAEIQAAIDAAVGADRHAQIVSMNRDRSILLVHVAANNTPGSYYYFNTRDERMTLLADVHKGFRPEQASPVSTIRYKARDGVEMEAVLTLPRGREARNLPLVLMPHGGPYARSTERWNWQAQFLASRGYAVLQPNYRGSAGYGQAFADLGEGQWGLKMQDDLNDAIDWMVGEGMADAGRVCIMGSSYGGYAALRAAQRDGGKFRCAIAYAGMADLTAMIRYGDRYLNSNSRRASWQENAPDVRLVSPIHFAPEFSAPVLLMHGRKDLRVPVVQSREMAKKLKAAGKEHRYVEQPEADHHFSREADRIEFLKEVEAFLARHNPA